MDALLQSRAQELASEFASQATTVEELNELMRLMIKSGLERMLEHGDGRAFRPAAGSGGCRSSAPVPAGEQRRSPNRRNGRSKKTVQGDLGEVTLGTPRDRDGTFEPQLIEKHQRRVPGSTKRFWLCTPRG